MAKLWKRTRDENGQSQLHEIDLAQHTITAPTMIYLSGYLTTDKRPGFIAGGIKRLEELLRDKPELSSPPQIYAWSHTSLSNLFNVAAYNFRPQHTYSAASARLADGIIMPLVSENNAPLPAEEARKRLRNLTFFGYSAGTVVAQEAFNAAFQKMQKIGYKPEEARQLLHEIVLVSAGNISRPTQEKNRFTTLYLAASNDLIIRWKNRLWGPLQNLFAKYAQQLKIKSLSETSLLITAAVQKKMWEWHKTSDGTKEKRDIAPQFPAWTGVSSNHELPHYITQDDEHNAFSKIVLNALINATTRQEKPNALQLLEPISSFAPQEVSVYRERIAKAVAVNKSAL